jgi:hypothetical protein
VPPDQPAFVVGLPEVDQREAELLDVAEGPDPEQVLLQRPDEPLGAAVALGGAEEGRRGRGAEPGDLALEIAGHVLGPVIVADGEAAGGVLRDAAEAFGDALPDRLQRLVACAVQGGEDADSLGRAMVDGDEDRDLALLHREACGHVGAPHRVDRLRDDRAVVGL